MVKKRRVTPEARGPCGNAHISAFKADAQQPDLYLAFSAAYDGCVDCVRQALNSGAVAVNQMSDSSAFDLMQWAIWGQAVGKNDTLGVQNLLLERGARRTPSSNILKAPSAERTVVFVKEETQPRPSTASASVGSRGATICTDVIKQEDKKRKRPGADTCAESHTRACSASHTGQPYLFFSAAFAGCS